MKNVNNNPVKKMYFKNLETVTGKKASLLYTYDDKIVPVVKLYLGEIDGKWIFTNVMGYLFY
jgi:hypothetical protein